MPGIEKKTGDNLRPQMRTPAQFGIGDGSRGCEPSTRLASKKLGRVASFALRKEWGSLETLF